MAQAELPGLVSAVCGDLTPATAPLAAEQLCPKTLSATSDADRHPHGPSRSYLDWCSCPTSPDVSGIPGEVAATDEPQSRWKQHNRPRWAGGPYAHARRL